jgi:hypothetical protein
MVFKEISKELAALEPQTVESPEHLPRRFDFYGLGSVESSRASCQLSDVGYSPLLVLFRVNGDEMGTCIVGVEPAPVSREDESMVTEMASILV